MGMAAFQRALGLPVQLYAPYFCNDTACERCRRTSARTPPRPSGRSLTCFLTDLANFSLVRSDATLSPDCYDFVRQSEACCPGSRCCVQL